MKPSLALLTAAAFAALSLTAKAQVITQVTGQSEFDSDLLTTPYVDDFSSGDSSSGFNNVITYTDTAGSFYDSQYANQVPNGAVYLVNSAKSALVGVGDGSTWLIGDGRGTVTFTANSGYSAIGANFFDAGSDGASLPITVTAALIANPTDTADDISHVFTLTVPPATGSASTTLTYFTGFIAPEGYEITTIVSAPGQNPGIDNLTAGAAAYPLEYVPEPASVGLLLIGSLSLVGWMRLRARSAKA